MKVSDLLKQTLFTFKNVPISEPFIQIAGRKVLTRGNFMTISGLPKSRKTTFLQFFMGSLLTGKEYFSIKGVKVENLTLVDTEQGQEDFERQYKSLTDLIETKPQNFNAYLFRQYEPEQIFAGIEYLLENSKIDCLVIDNITELAMNPNDPIEARKINQKLKTWSTSYNCAIIVILHNSKGNDFTTGHLGSYLDRGCQALINIERDVELPISTMSAKYLRSDREFIPIPVQMDLNTKKFKQLDYVAPVEDQKRAPFELQNYDLEFCKNLVEILFKDESRLHRSEVVAGVQNALDINSKYAGRVVARCKDFAILHSKNGLYQTSKFEN